MTFAEEMESDRHMPNVREEMISKCEEIFKVTPKDLQLDVVECIGQGQDCILIAGCGWGKTLVYFLPLVLWTDRIIVVISPLKAIMEEQHQKLHRTNISSIIFDGEAVIDQKTIENAASGKFKAVFMTPEIIFQNKALKQLWTKSRWLERLQAIVVDEAHCISNWGPEFRPEYSRIGELREWVPKRVAFIALSATLPRPILDDIKHQVRFDGDVKVINVGNDRPNVKLEVRLMQPRASNKFKELDFVLDFQKTIIYFESRNETVEAADYLQSMVDDENKKKIAPYHAISSSRHKKTTMDQFRDGEVLVMTATEAAGMGCDINDILRVVQFKCPSSITCLVQRLGRAARDPNLKGHGILLTSDPNALTRIPDTHLADFMKTTDCRRRVLNSVFGNENVQVDDCCDRCNPSTMPLRLPTNILPKGLVTIIEVKPFVPKRTAAHKERARKVITEWRSKVFDRDFSHLWGCLKVQTVMSDKFINILADNFAKLMVGETVLTILPTWAFYQEKCVNELTDDLINLNKEIDAVNPEVGPSRSMPRPIGNNVSSVHGQNQSNFRIVQYDGSSKKRKNPE